MKTLVLIVIVIALTFTFIGSVCEQKTVEHTNEKNEEARKKLLEKEEMDIELDGNE